MLDIDYRGATGSLIHITSGRSDLTLQDAERNRIIPHLGLNPMLMLSRGARVKNDMEGKVRVMAIMTGVDRRRSWEAGSPTRPSSRISSRKR